MEYRVHGGGALSLRRLCKSCQPSSCNICVTLEVVRVLIDWKGVVYCITHKTVRLFSQQPPTDADAAAASVVRMRRPYDRLNNLNISPNTVDVYLLYLISLWTELEKVANKSVYPTWITLPYCMQVPSSFLFSLLFCFFSNSAACCHTSSRHNTLYTIIHISLHCWMHLASQ